MPRPETVDRAIAEIGKSTANYRYFFEKLNAPGWLRPLADRGRFNNPPKEVPVEGGVFFPGWPESQYLTRMAKIPQAQTEVLRIALAIPATDNVQVHADLMEVALSLPSPMAAQLADRIATWVQKVYESTISMKIGDLIAHLATGGQADAALRVSTAAFALEPAQPMGEEQEWAPSRGPRAYLKDWYYERALKTALGPLVATEAQRTFVLVCDLLDRAMMLSGRSADAGGQDYSYIWHNAVEHDAQPALLGSILVGAVRDAAEMIVRANAGSLVAVLTELRRHQWVVFKRLEYHVLERFAPVAVPEIAALAVGLAALPYDTRHEAARLLKAAFEHLPQEKQEEVLQWIAANPTDDEVVERFALAQQERTPEAVTKFKQRWQAQRYVLFERDVPATWRKRVDATLAAAGEVQPPDELGGDGGWVGPTSPKSRDDLEALGPAGTMRFLREWQPPSGQLVDTPEGLGRVLESVVAHNPGEYAAVAEDFEGLDPTFVRFFFSGIETAIREHRPVRWAPVLGLAEWVMRQPREIPGRRTMLMEADESWQWTRGAIASLFEHGLNQRPARENEPASSPVPFAERDRVWAALEPLTHDPDPTPDHEAKFGGDNMDPPTLAINTVRGKAMNAVIAYALWVRYHLDQQAERPPATFDVMPETRQVLDDHLNTVNDPSFAIRSTYGHYFPYLHLIDPGWAQGAIPRIFSPEEGGVPYWNAAWSAYLMFSRPYDALLPLLTDQYARAVQQLGIVTKRRGFGPDDRLAEHLMVYYWRDQLRLDSALLRDFFRIAPDSLRGHALSFLGRSLPQNQPIEEGVLARLKSLWEARVAWARLKDHAASSKEELAQFGWWFSSQQFDPAWSFQQLRLVLNLVKTIQPDFKVAEALDALAKRFPREAVDAVRLIAVADRKGWEICANEPHFTKIIATALASGNADAKTAADDLIQYFVTRGHFSYRSLLV